MLSASLSLPFIIYFKAINQFIHGFYKSIFADEGCSPVNRQERQTHSKSARRETLTGHNFLV